MEHVSLRRIKLTSGVIREKGNKMGIVRICASFLYFVYTMSVRRLENIKKQTRATAARAPACFKLAGDFDLII